MNVNDLGLFRALDVKVQRCRRGMLKRGKMDPEQLARDVVATYAAFDVEKLLDKIYWKYKRYVMRCVEATTGGNMRAIVHRQTCQSPLCECSSRPMVIPMRFSFALPAYVSSRPVLPRTAIVAGASTP